MTGSAFLASPSSLLLQITSSRLFAENVETNIASSWGQLYDSIKVLSDLTDCLQAELSRRVCHFLLRRALVP